ncbi:MAG: hypothetical protein GY865_09355, partial [candidate division Zixibacteria bacterium]|nr:hypothetical protein [candidate division Zixibacteria bacterium]
MFGRFIGFSVLIILFIVAPSLLADKEAFYSEEITKALEDAGDNRAELDKVLSYYTSDDDSLKLQAALYLIGNMEGHCYVTYDLIDTIGTPINFNVLDYMDYTSLTAATDTLEAQYGLLDFKKNEKIYDFDIITSDFLIKQIDYAFKAWREKPWAQNLSFDYFCEYVLPYRGSNEPLEDWRQTFLEKYNSMESDMIDKTNPIEAAAIINDDIKSWFGFDPRYYYHPTDQGLSEMVENGLGR